MLGKGWTDGSEIKISGYKVSQEDWEKIFGRKDMGTRIEKLDHPPENFTPPIHEVTYEPNQAGNRVRDIPEDKPIGVDLFEGSPQYLERTKEEWTKEVNGNNT